MKKITKSSLIITISGLVVGSYLLFSVAISIYSIYAPPMQLLSMFVVGVKDFFQILFFIVVATVGVLSYMRARETLFTPIKTEVFKMQIKVFEDILGFFQNKTEMDFVNQFDFRSIVEGNARLMINDYISTFFEEEAKIDEDAHIRVLDKYKFSGAIISESFMVKNYETFDSYAAPVRQPKQKITSPSLILANWKDYEYGQRYYTNQYQEEINKIKRLIASPLLPSDLKTKLEHFEGLVGDNLLLVGAVLTDIAAELPKQCPNLDSIRNLQVGMFWNRFNKKRLEQEPTAHEILSL